MAVHTLEICSGVGMLGEGLRAGLRYLGIETRTVCHIEREAYPASVLASRMQEKSLDDAPVWSDLLTFNARALHGAVDCIVAGFPCFVAGTSVLTKAGYKPIETLQIGDIVLTHAGNWKPITSVMRKTGANLRVVRGTGMLATTTTDEHPYYVRCKSTVWDSAERRGKRQFSCPEWVDAANLGGQHFTGQVLPVEQQDNRGDDFWWLVGRYLADGWRVDRSGRKNGRVVICANAEESDMLAARIKAAGFVASCVCERTVKKFHITRGDFYEFLAGFGRLAHGKTLPGWCLELPQPSARALFDGWASGDGWRNEKQGNISVTTVSRELALGMALLAQRAFGRVANVYFADMPAKCTIEGRTVNQRGQYTVRVCDRNRSSFVDGNYGWRAIRGNESAGCGDVFNISVADDESYVANGAIVHNCQDLSVAGKRVGLDGKRSGLFFNILDIADDCGAQQLFLENVAGIASASASVVDEAQELEERAASRVLGELAERGWDAEWLTLSATAVGASHGRARWFCFAWRRLGNAGLQHQHLQQWQDGAEHQRAGGELGNPEHDGQPTQPKLRSNEAAGHEWRQEEPQQAGESARASRSDDVPSLHGGASRSEQRASFDCGCGAVADTGSAGCEGLKQRRALSSNWGGAQAHGSTEQLCSPLFAPGPNSPEWPGIIRDFPWLAPALSIEGQEDAKAAFSASESLLHRKPDGLAAGLDFDARAQRLKCCGNGVAPTQAAVAACILIARAKGVMQ